MAMEFAPSDLAVLFCMRCLPPFQRCSAPLHATTCNVWCNSSTPLGVVQQQLRCAYMDSCCVAQIILATYLNLFPHGSFAAMLSLSLQRASVLPANRPHRANRCNIINRVPGQRCVNFFVQDSATKQNMEVEYQNATHQPVVACCKSPLNDAKLSNDANFMHCESVVQARSNAKPPSYGLQSE